MVREAFSTRKRFLGVPKVLCAGWVGTIKHSTMADGVERAEQRHSCCGWMRAIVKVTKNMVHTKQKHTHHIHLRF
jgi:hypothetical protein